MRPILTAVVLLGLVVGCGDSKKGTPPAPNQPTSPGGATVREAPAPIPVLEALPVDVDFVAGARIADLAGQGLVVRAVSLMFARDPELEARLTRLFEICKIDPTRDLESVVVGLGRGQDRALMVVSGQLSEPDLARCASQGMAELGGTLKTSTSPSGHTLYHAAGKHEVHFAFLASGTVAVSASREWLEQALGSGEKVGAHAVLGPLLGQVRREAGLWLVGRVPAEVGVALVTAVHGELENPPIAFLGHVDLKAGLKAELGLVMDRAEDANSAASKAIPQLALSSLVVQRFSLGPVVNKIQVVVEGSVLYVRIALTQAEVDETLARLDLIGSPGTEVDSEGRPQQDTPIRNQ